MGALSRSVLTGQDTAEAIVTRLRETFGPAGGRAAGADGPRVGDRRCDRCGRAGRPGRRRDTRVTVDDTHVIVLCGAPLRASDQRVLEAFAVQTSLVLEYRRLRERDDGPPPWSGRTRPDGACCAPSPTTCARRWPRCGPPSTACSWAGSRRRTGELVAVGGDSADQLEALIDNLLDLSRVQTGLVHPVLRDAAWRRSLPLAVAGQPPGRSPSRWTRHAARTHRLRPARARRRQPGRATRSGSRRGNAGEPVRVLAHATRAWR